jgi:DNA repair protein RadC
MDPLAPPAGPAAPPHDACPLPFSERPAGAAERLLGRGEEGLSEEELVGLVLSSRGAAAGRLLGRFGSLRALARASALEIERGGVSRAAAVRVAAALALARRLAGSPLRCGRVLRQSEEIFQAFGPRMRDLVKERFLAVHVDAKNRYLREHLISEGSLTASLVHPREVFAPAIRERAAAILLVHNHPSGDPEPSPEDQSVTRRLVEVGGLVGIRVLDHVVVGDGRYVSFAERSWLDA